MLKFPRVSCTSPSPRSASATSERVVVLPTLPVTATTGPWKRRRTSDARDWSARRASSTRTYPADQSGGIGLEEITPAQPASSAAPTKASPSKDSPESARNHWPGRRERVSVPTLPADEDRTSSPPVAEASSAAENTTPPASSAVHGWTEGGVAERARCPPRETPARTRAETVANAAGKRRAASGCLDRGGSSAKDGGGTNAERAAAAPDAIAVHRAKRCDERAVQHAAAARRTFVALTLENAFR